MSTQQETRQAVIYCRISQDRTGEASGVKRQEEDCRKLADRLGWDVVKVYTDNDVSAYSGKPRRKYAAMMRDLRQGKANAVLAWHHDRLWRNLNDQLSYIDLSKKLSLPTHTVTAGVLDLSTPQGRAAAVTVGAWAQAESEHKAERITRKHQESATEGKYRGGRRPFGYEDDGMTIRKSEANEIRRIVKLIIACDVRGGIKRGSQDKQEGSLRFLMNDLNERGIFTTTGRPWANKSFRDMLMRPRNAGLSVYRGEIVGKGQWKPILSETDWKTLCDILKDPMRLSREGSNANKHLLSGIATCGVCQKGMKARASKSNSPYYHCCVFRNQKQLDAYVVDYVKGLLLDPESSRKRMSHAAETDTGNLWTERQELTESLSEYVQLAADRDISARDFAKINKGIKERLTEIDKILNESQSDSLIDEILSAKDAWQVWQGSSLLRKRSVIRALLTITVLPIGKGNYQNLPFEEGIKMGLAEREGKIGDVARMIPEEGTTAA